jgi:hypothetical protein
VAVAGTLSIFQRIPGPFIRRPGSLQRLAILPLEIPQPCNRPQNLNEENLYQKMYRNPLIPLRNGMKKGRKQMLTAPFVHFAGN